MTSLSPQRRAYEAPNRKLSEGLHPSSDRPAERERAKSARKKKESDVKKRNQIKALSSREATREI